ncbi:MAG: ABC transporter ATP-binding protein [Deltaproteobacteria bacterium]|nr:ABC transporter ATP-binding protein [Deltaproteobacteria bacterium]
MLQRQAELLLGALALLICIMLGSRAARMLGEFSFAHLEERMALDIQRDLVEHTLRLPKAFFDENQTGYLMSRLSSDVEELRWFFSSTIVQIIGNVFRFFGGTVLLFYLQWRLALAVILLVPAILLCLKYFSGKVLSLSHHGMEREAKVTMNLKEALSSAALIKSSASEAKTVASLVSGLKEALHSAMERAAVGSVANLAINSIPGLMGLVVLGVGATWVIRGEWSLGSLLAFQAYTGYVFGPAQALATANLQMQESVAGLQRISNLFALVPEEGIGKGKLAHRLEGEVEFRGVSFSYGGREPLLKDCSFRVSPGEHVAVVGRSGAGKTTLLSLILGLYRPAQGEILFDGIPASEYEIGSLRERIGYVSQNVRLLSGTIKENLLFARTDATEGDMLRACQAAGIHEFITSLPGGYETQIGEEGVLLSEGQKQRIALARTLVRDPDILVLDEPTSSQDGKTERSIMGSLPEFSRGKTMFLVTNRLGALQGMSRVLFLREDGMLVTGTHRTLWKSSESYRALVK